MVKIYGSMLCPDCVKCRAAFDEQNIPYEMIDMTGSMAALKEFLVIRDTGNTFDAVRENKGVGVPVLVDEDGTVTLDYDAWLSAHGYQTYPELHPESADVRMPVLTPFFRSILETDPAPVVICDLTNTIIYMNPASHDAYAAWGGKALLGKCIFDCHRPETMPMIEKVVSWFGEKEDHNVIHTFFNPKANKDVYMYALRDEKGTLIGYYEKHEFRTPDTMPCYDLK